MKRTMKNKIWSILLIFLIVSFLPNISVYADECTNDLKVEPNSTVNSVEKSPSYTVSYCLKNLACPLSSMDHVGDNNYEIGAFVNYSLLNDKGEYYVWNGNTKTPSGTTWKEIFEEGIYDGLMNWNDILGYDHGFFINTIDVMSVMYSDTIGVHKEYYKTINNYCEIDVVDSASENSTTLGTFWHGSKDIDLQFGTIPRECKKKNYTAAQAQKLVASIVCHEYGHRLGLDDNYYTTELPSYNTYKFYWGEAKNSIMSYSRDRSVTTKPSKLDAMLVNQLYFNNTAIMKNIRESDSPLVQWNTLINTIPKTMSLNTLGIYLRYDMLKIRQKDL